MGIFDRFKKNENLFSKNIEPKCAYCEHGKPARSQGKILCPRCGLVDENYSCKKFTYSPFLRIPERGIPEEKPIAESPKVPEPEAKPVAESPKAPELEAKPVAESPKGPEPEAKPVTESPKTPEPVNDAPSLSAIANRVEPKKIKLPDVSGNVVSSIENKPPKRDTEGYLKQITSGTVAEIKNSGGVTHQLPADTKIASIDDM